MRFAAAALVIATAATLIPCPVSAEMLRGTAEVIDGDTLEFGFRRVDLYGADSLERFQRCKRAGETYACGARAIQALYDMTSKGALRCEVIERNRVNRELVTCQSAGGQDLSRHMIRQGWAVATEKAFAALEQQAERARRGAWAGAFIRPRQWRGGKRLEGHGFKRSFRSN